MRRRCRCAQSRYTEARSHLASAESLPTDAIRRQEALALRRSIDAAQSVEALRIADQRPRRARRQELDAAQTQVARLEAVAPGHSALAGLRAEVERLRASLQGVARVANIERLGVKLFLSGDYKESADQLERAVGSGVTSPRIYLFLASSRAAQALLAPQGERPALVAEARRHYALAKPAAASADGGSALHLTEHPAAVERKLSRPPHGPETAKAGRSPSRPSSCSRRRGGG